VVAWELQMNKFGEGSGDASRRAGPVANVTAGGQDAPQLYVITLMSSLAPMPLQGLSAPELAGLAVFRSQRREDGRDRFRQHLGYFASAKLAEEALQLVRDAYPAAFVSIAPETNMGSLDDTAIARFSVIRPVETEPERPAADEVMAPQPAAGPPARPGATARRTAGTVAPPKQSAVVSEPAQQRTTQHYAVQLLWSERAIDPGKIPNLEIFNGYLLYAVETARDGSRMYGMRLGFYVDALSAGLVARYVRPRFKDAAVVPVSDREHERASSAVIGLASRRAGRRVSARAAWPVSAIPVDFAPASRGRASATT
jgi:hypothetical protein